MHFERRYRPITGLTTLQAVIALAVMAAVAAIIIAIMRGQQYKRAQALVFTQPGDVLELRATPVKSEFAWDEEIIVLCELSNRTNHQLLLPELMSAALAFDNDIIATGGSMIGYQHFIEPKETLSQEIRLKTEYVGLPRRKHGAAGFAKIVFHGNGHTSDSVRLENGEYSQSIKPNAPVLQSGEFEIAITVEENTDGLN